MSELRKRGLNTAVIVSTPFEQLGRTQAKVLGAPDLPLILITHPLGGLDEDGVRSRAAEVIPRLLQLMSERAQ
jgi:hypothetical protein